MKYLVTMLKAIQFPVESNGDEPILLPAKDAGFVILNTKDGDAIVTQRAHIIDIAQIAEAPLIEKPTMKVV